MSGYPWPPPPGSRPTIGQRTWGAEVVASQQAAQPQATEQVQVQAMPTAPGTMWAPVDVSRPMPVVPISQYIALFPRDRPIDAVIGVAAGTPAYTVIRCDYPTVIYALAGGVMDTTGADFPVGHDPLSFFTIDAQYATGERLITNTVQGVAMVGTAQRPRYVGGVGWMVNGGSSVQVTITPLRADLRIDVNLWTIEVRSGANFVPPAPR